MIDARAQVANFLKEWGTSAPPSEDADLFGTLGITGDDAFEFIESFAAKFGVDVAGYLWYFHHGEEPMLNVGALFFKPPHRRVARIPITPRLLSEAIDAKRWPLKYPEHQLPRARWDIRITWIMEAAVGSLLLAAALLQSFAR